MVSQDASADPILFVVRLRKQNFGICENRVDDRGGEISIWIPVRPYQTKPIKSNKREGEGEQTKKRQKLRE